MVASLAPIVLLRNVRSSRASGSPWKFGSATKNSSLVHIEFIWLVSFGGTVEVNDSKNRSTPELPWTLFCWKFMTTPWPTSMTSPLAPIVVKIVSLAKPPGSVKV